MNGDLDKLFSVEDFRKFAKRRLPSAVFNFVDGGAEDEVTLSANTNAFQSRRIIPRILTDVSEPDISSPGFAGVLPTPLAIAPMGSCALVRPSADLDIAKAAATRGIPYCLSTMSTTSMEDMARSIDGALWFQLYVLKNHDFNEELVRKAEALGYAALIVTVDLQAGGKREKDLKAGVSIPLRPSIKTLLDGALHPSWALRQMAGGMPQFENVQGYLGDKRAGLTIAALVGQNLDAGFVWDGLKRLRDLWKGPLLVKGVMHPDDAEGLVELGVDGLWVSNHGGRQLDGAVSSLESLAAISDRLNGRLPMVLDSGVRRGSDVLKAKALGANISAIGRAALYGAVAGEEGVARVLDIMLDEITRSMKLAGKPSFSAISRDLLV